MRRTDNNKINTELEMEADSGGDDSTSFEFGFDNHDGNNLIVGANNTQASPNETAGNFSNEPGELGSSCGSSNLLTMKSDQSNSKQNLGTPTSPNDGELLGPPSQEGVVSKLLEKPAASSSFNPPSMGTPVTPQSYPPTLESQQPTEGNISRNENDSGKASGPSVVNAPNLLRLDLEAPSREHVETAGAGGNTESYQSLANLGQNLMQFAYSHVDPLFANCTNAGQTRTSSLIPPLQNPAQQFPPITVETVPRNGIGQPYSPEHDPNWMSLNQLNAQSQNAFQSGFLSPHQANQSSTLSPSSIYTASVPQSSEWRGIADGRPSWITQQQPNWLSPDQSAPYRPFTQSGPQYMVTNEFDLQHSNSMLPGTSLLFRPQQSSMQQRNQVTAAAPNVYDPQSHYTMYPRLQQFSLQQCNQVPAVPNVCDIANACNTVLPDPSLSLRPPEFPYAYHQVPAAPNSSNPQYYQSVFHNSSFPSRLQQLDGYSQHFPGQMQMPDGYDLQTRPQVSPLSRLQTENPQRLLHGIKGTSASNNYLDISQRSQILNSENRQDTRDKNTVMCQLDLEASLSNHKEKGILGRRCHERSRYEIGESSAPKRSKRDSISRHDERDQSASSPQPGNRTPSSHDSEGRSDISNVSKQRFIPNSVYDPLFEGIGLAIDPHLRMFALI